MNWLTHIIRRIFTKENMQKGEYEKAISDYTEIIEINPKLAVGFYGRGHAYDAKGEYEKAITDFTKAIEIDPKFAKPMSLLGEVYEIKGDKEKAKYWYNQAINNIDASEAQLTKVIRERLNSLE